MGLKDPAAERERVRTSMQNLREIRKDEYKGKVQERLAAIKDLPIQKRPDSISDEDFLRDQVCQLQAEFDVATGSAKATVSKRLSEVRDLLKRELERQGKKAQPSRLDILIERSQRRRAGLLTAEEA